ncbi:Rne/Rng family ribonuclease [Nitrospina gracilis]|uniref:Rne/Rng family ribonuclease n=1 Tax=Nitrospina gracilis TaxID=35801 RepID=UPI001F000A52|nr:Rne/Rng family ribonuclease [Nitrospina gracilis]MCF8720698.1 ribonuclease E [Nitrospina gracilis Nb-211]
MSKKKKLLINAEHPEECRAVIIEDGKIQEYIVEHSSRELLKGNVYLGVITRVEPAIEACFVDFGGKKYGFLPFKDVLRESYLQTGERKSKTRIQDVLIRGQKLLVQVVKESRDAKGPSLTNAVTIPGRFLVLMCSKETSGISRKIEDESERKKMKEVLSDLQLPEDMGVILRTAGMGRTKLELQKDLQMLMKIWEGIQEKLQDPETKAPCLLYKVPDMVVRTVRDHFTNDTSEIIVDNADSYKAVKEFMRMVMPRMRNRIKYSQETKPIFSQYKIEEQIENIYKKRVDLPSGGSLVFDVGEAMVAIDVNSGKTTSSSDLEDTATRTNMEAAEEIGRQLRLRDLGGLIVIDFIDMFSKKNKSNVEKEIKKSCKSDKARINISRISRFGLLEMSRQRLSSPVKEGNFEQCSLCQGTGFTRTDSSLSLNVLRKVREILAEGNVKVLAVEVSTAVASYLLNHKTKYLQELQDKTQCLIQFTAKDRLAYENFSYTVLERKREEERQMENRSRGIEFRTAAPETAARPESRPEGRSDSRPESRPEGRPDSRSEDRGDRDRRGRGRRPSSRGRSSRSGGARGGSRNRPNWTPRAEAEEGETEAAVDTPSLGNSKDESLAPGVETPPVVTAGPAFPVEDAPPPSVEAESEASESGAEKPEDDKPATRGNRSGRSRDGRRYSNRRRGGSGRSRAPRKTAERTEGDGEESSSQPVENVSRLHEVVLDNRPPYKAADDRDDEPKPMRDDLASGL